MAITQIRWHRTAIGVIRPVLEPASFCCNWRSCLGETSPPADGGVHAIGGDESRGSSRVNKHVKDAIREDTATAQAAGHESAISELYHLAQSCLA